MQRKKWNSKQVVAEIHEENKPSITLLEKLGFNVISQEKTFVIYGVEV